tara:strand:+ start:175 stop:702 length:528 start_codon:yes stop_codon:yes gene_type:complete
MNRFLYLSFIMMQLTSCSFSSSQFDLIRNMISPENNSSKPEKNWNAYWMDRKIDLYAINVHDQVIFADEKINIFYKDRQIYKITGLLPELQSLEIESKDNLLLFMSDGRQIGVDSCELGYSVPTGENYEKYLRSCFSAKTNKTYENHILFNSEGMIISLRFKIHPEYNPLQLSMK